MHWRRSTRPQPTTSNGTAARTGSSKPSRRLIDGVLHAWETALGSPIELIVRHFEKRIFELTMATSQMGEGLLLLFSPGSMQASSFRLMLLYLSTTACTVLFLTAGIARIIALALNGHWMPGGAIVRACCSILGAFMWLMLAWALIIYTQAEGKPLSPGVPIYITLTVFEIVSVYRAIHGLKRWRLYGQSD